MYGTRDASLETSSNFRPMNRLIENTVFSGLVTAWRLATWPTSRSPSFANADDRRRDPRAFLVDDDRRLAAFHDGDDRVGRAEVDSNHFSWHLLSPPSELSLSFTVVESSIETI